MSDVLKDTFTVNDTNGGEYTFRIPSIVFDMQVSYKAAEIRRRAYPEGQGALGTIDFQAVQFSRYCAFLELYLTGANKLWPYGFEESRIDKLDPKVLPVVNFEKFPVSSGDLIYEVGAAFEEAYSRFRRPGNSDQRPAGP
jgi:hypothetical protein